MRKNGEFLSFPKDFTSALRQKLETGWIWGGGCGFAQYDQSRTRWAFLCAAAPLSLRLSDVRCPPIGSRSAILWTEPLLRAVCDKFVGNDVSHVRHGPRVVKAARAIQEAE